MNFYQNLTIGNNFETNIVKPYLLNNYKDYYILSTHSFKTSDYCGPTIENINEVVTMPDFMLLNPNNGHKILIEAKYRNKPFSISGYINQKFVGVEYNDVNQYQKASQILQADLMFCIGLEETKTMHIDTLSNTVNHYFDNKYYKGYVSAFNLNNQNLVYRW